MAIGSVYQWFPDKRAVVQALAMRTLDVYLQRLNDRFMRDDLIGAMASLPESTST